MSKFTRKAGLRGLCITRREGQRIVINHGELVVEVVQIKGRQVRLVFSAAKDIPIQREEQVKPDETSPTN